MRKFQLIIITGLPGTGKTTLARELAAARTLPLICKDTIKEPLLNVVGSGLSSRALSDLSFTIMFALAKELLACGDSLILDGNFRCGEHEAPLLAALPPHRPDIVQVLCQTDEEQRRAILLRRARDPTRHPGHLDARQLQAAPVCDSFLELPGARHSYRVGSRPCETLF